MATTWIKPIHKNKGKSISATLGARTDYITDKDKTAPLAQDSQALENAGDYIQNPDKTGGSLVAGYECDPGSAHTDFLLSKKEYTAKTGRRHKSDVLAYHMRQAFKPGEITPEKANELGYDLAMRWTKGNHAFVVATHTDKSHVLSFNGCFQHHIKFIARPPRPQRLFRLRRDSPAP